MAKVYQVADPSFGHETHEFPEEYSHVATVDSEDLNQVFQLTNSVTKPWWENEGVEKEFIGDGCRSTSVGDVVVLSNGDHYRCDPIGWTKLP